MPETTDEKKVRSFSVNALDAFIVVSGLAALTGALHDSAPGVVLLRQRIEELAMKFEKIVEEADPAQLKSLVQLMLDATGPEEEDSEKKEKDNDSTQATT